MSNDDPRIVAKALRREMERQRPAAGPPSPSIAPPTAAAGNSEDEGAVWENILGLFEHFDARINRLEAERSDDRKIRQHCIDVASAFT